MWNCKLFAPTVSSESDSPNSSPHSVQLEFSTDPSFPPSSDLSSYTTYSSTTSNKSTPTFPSDRSTSNSPTPVFPEDKFPPSDDESDDSLVDFDIDPKSENVNKKRAVFQVAEVPFNTLAQMIRLYLESVIKDPSKPVCPFQIWIGTRSEIFEGKLKNSKWWTAVWDTITFTWMKKIKLKEVHIIEMSVNNFLKTNKGNNVVDISIISN